MSATVSEHLVTRASLRAGRDVGASHFDRLEPLLARISKPIQYVGGEVNCTAQAVNTPVNSYQI